LQPRLADEITDTSGDSWGQVSDGDDDDEQPVISYSKTAPMTLSTLMPDIISINELQAISTPFEFPRSEMPQFMMPPITKGMSLAEQSTADMGESCLMQTELEDEIDANIDSNTSLSHLPRGMFQVSCSESEQQIAVQWNVDMRRRNSTSRCRMVKKFNATVDSKDVTFILQIEPVAKEIVETETKRRRRKNHSLSTFRRPGSYAFVWIECLNPDELRGYSFELACHASDASHKLAEAHDFASEPRCMPKSQTEALFQIPEEDTWPINVVMRFAF
jgi:hypothetical protein